MKKILGLTLAAILMIAVVGGGTWAYFSDTEASTNNTLTAGTLDLTINAGNVAVTTFSATTLKPGDNNDSSHAASAIKNVGSLSGTLDVVTSATTNTPGAGSTEFEGGSGELGGVATIAMYIDVDKSGTWTSGDIGLKADATTYANSGATALQYASIDTYATKTWTAIETMTPGADQKFCVNYRIPTGAGNSIQGDSVKIDFTFNLNQA